MKVTLRYFGMIAEAVEKNSEVISFEEISKQSSLRVYFNEKYPFLSDMSYQIAIDNELSEEINNDVKEIALLPPFAGG